MGALFVSAACFEKESGVLEGVAMTLRASRGLPGPSGTLLIRAATLLRTGFGGQWAPGATPQPIRAPTAGK